MPTNQRAAWSCCQGWPVFFVLAFVMAVFYGALLLEPTEEGLRLMIRTSGRVSAGLFAVVFATSSLLQFSRNRVTAWLRGQRRFLGLAVAWSQLLHLLGLAALAAEYPDPFLHSVGLVTLLGGGMAYLFLLAMAATSSPRAVRVLGAQRWHRLHWVGGWWIWAVFAQTLWQPLSVWTVLIFGAAGSRVWQSRAWTAGE